ncbi:MAG TPA: SMI1/KNR4 family protein [Gemmatales bacterium]|nr:SMI1/KNR4 family protein [Gemmatales bacterium]
MAKRRKQTFPDWRKWLPTLHEEVELCDPASEGTVKAAENALCINFPDALRSLLLSTDGVVGPFGCWLVWPAEMIVSENREYRSSPDLKGQYMPFDHLLFIGEVGNGDLFAYPIMSDGNACYKNDIFRWDHEMDNRSWVANNLEQYLRGFTDGTISE